MAILERRKVFNALGAVSDAMADAACFTAQQTMAALKILSVPKLRSWWRSTKYYRNRPLVETYPDNPETGVPGVARTRAQQQAVDFVHALRGMTITVLIAAGGLVALDWLGSGGLADLLTQVSLLSDSIRGVFLGKPESMNVNSSGVVEFASSFINKLPFWIYGLCALSPMALVAYLAINGKQPDPTITETMTQGEKFF